MILVFTGDCSKLYHIYVYNPEIKYKCDAYVRICVLSNGYLSLRKQFSLEILRVI